MDGNPDKEWRIGRINGVFRTCARSRGGPAVHLGPGRRGITCRSSGMGGSFQAGNRAFRAEMLRFGTQQDGPPPLGCRKALSAGVYEFRLRLGTRRGDGRRGVQPDAVQVGSNRRWLRQSGDDLHVPATMWAHGDIDQEDTREQAGPGEAVGGPGRLWVLRRVGAWRVCRVFTSVFGTRARHDMLPAGRPGLRLAGAGCWAQGRRDSAPGSGAEAAPKRRVSR